MDNIYALCTQSSTTNVCIRKTCCYIFKNIPFTLYRNSCFAHTPHNVLIFYTYFGIFLMLFSLKCVKTIFTSVLFFNYRKTLSTESCGDTFVFKNLVGNFFIIWVYSIFVNTFEICLAEH